MNTPKFNPYIRRAWYHIMVPNSSIHERVIFDYELLYIKDGSCTINVENRTYHPEPGDFFLFRPKLSHAINVEANTPLIQPHIHFDLVYSPDSPLVPVNYTPLDMFIIVQT